MSPTSCVGHKPLPPTPIVTVRSLDSKSEGKLTTTTTRPWRPITLQRTLLSALVLITAGLIATIQYLQFISNQNQGILFAKDINELPLRKSFCYLYLPTVISVIYSFIWAWVDLDVKRLEPYFQLSTPGGVIGNDSILLSYPLEFLAFLPFTAFKRKHWSVLVGSVIVILVFWGITPTQAGIFAVRTITIREHESGSHATSYIPLSQQSNQSAVYAQSVYNIAWLNETLPPFMTKDYVLSAFGPMQRATSYASNITYTSSANMYSVDVSCDEAVLSIETGAGTRYNSSAGCVFYAPPYRPQGGNDTSKPYDTMYVGYQNQNGFADYYLASDCDEEFLHYFFIRWSKSSDEFITSGKAAAKIDPGQANATALFCRAEYYQQKVNATISWPSNAVQEVRPSGDKLPLPDDMFNTSSFEWAMSSGQLQDYTIRGDFPTIGFPDQKSRLANTQLNLDYIPKMAPFAIATDQRPLEQYLDSETLRLSYQSAYRLLFARQLVDVLEVDLDNSTEAVGQRTYVTQAVVVVPGFAYAATALLVLVLLLAIALTIQTLRRPNNLKCDPATIGDVMDLIEGDPETLEPFLSLDNSSTSALQTAVGSSRYCLNDSGRFCRVRGHTGVDADEADISHTKSTTRAKSKGIRPTEMKAVIGILFFALQVGAIVTFLVLYLKANRGHGLALPSQSTFVRQLTENYIPIALATFMEPFWLILNRLLSILCPFEELRKGCARASKSIDVDYTSLPPQFLIVRAYRAGHYLLALVGFMALSANVLSVALSGMMYEGTSPITSSTKLASLKSARFRFLNGTGLPFNSNDAANSQGVTTSDPFYRMMSNLTANTPLPAWTDDLYAYLPVDISGIGANSTLQLQTTSFGAGLVCESPNTTRSALTYNLSFSQSATAAFLDVSLARSDGSVVACTAFEPWSGDTLSSLKTPEDGHVALEIGVMLTSNTSVTDDLFCRQHILAGWIRMDWEVTGGAVRQFADSQDYGSRNMSITSRNETVLICKPDIEIGTAEISVDGRGRVQKLVERNMSSSLDESHFTSESADLVAQANQFLVSNGGAWHKDSYPSDFINYLIKESTNDADMLNATQPVPDAAFAASRLKSMYRRLFAVLISTNAELLFEDSPGDRATTGIITTFETRIFFSTAAFAVAEAILACYILTTLVFYLRRPWRVLPRLPSTVASCIAYFAASRAVHELYTACGGESKDAVKRVRSSWAWGYGTFMGTDGQSHVGIEKEPLVSALTKDGVVVKTVAVLK